MSTTLQPKLISFKDVGIKAVSRTELNPPTPIVPIGIKTPLEFDIEGKEIFKMHFNLKDQIADNLKNLILTNHGERLGLYNFGANLRPLLSEWSNKEDFDQEAMLRINTAISNYMQFVTPIGFDSIPSFEDKSHIKLFLMYSVPSLKLLEEVIQIDMFFT